MRTPTISECPFLIGRILEAGKQRQARRERWAPRIALAKQIASLVLLIVVAIAAALGGLWLAVRDYFANP